MSGPCSPGRCRTPDSPEPRLGPCPAGSPNGLHRRVELPIRRVHDPAWRVAFGAPQPRWPTAGIPRPRPRAPGPRKSGACHPPRDAAPESPSRGDAGPRGDRWSPGRPTPRAGCGRRPAGGSRPSRPPGRRRPRRGPGGACRGPRGPQGGGGLVAGPAARADHLTARLGGGKAGATQAGRRCRPTSRRVPCSARSRCESS